MSPRLSSNYAAEDGHTRVLQEIFNPNKPMQNTYSSITIFTSCTSRLADPPLHHSVPSLRSLATSDFSGPCGFAPSSFHLLLLFLSSFLSSPSQTSSSTFPSTAQTQALSFMWPVRMGRSSCEITWVCGPLLLGAYPLEAELTSKYKQHQGSPQHFPPFVQLKSSFFLRYKLNTTITINVIYKVQDILDT